MEELILRHISPSNKLILHNSFQYNGGILIIDIIKNVDIIKNIIYTYKLSIYNPPNPFHFDPNNSQPIKQYKHNITKYIPNYILDALKLIHLGGNQSIIELHEKLVKILSQDFTIYEDLKFSEIIKIDAYETEMKEYEIEIEKYKNEMEEYKIKLDNIICEDSEEDINKNKRLLKILMEEQQKNMLLTNKINDITELYESLIDDEKITY